MPKTISKQKLYLKKQNLEINQLRDIHEDSLKEKRRS